MKSKTHQSMSKRVKVTSTGKIMHKPAGVSHLRTNKSPRRTALVELHSNDTKRIRRMLPNAQ